MQFTKLMVVVLGCAATLFAADPFSGTWKMNPAKSKFKSGTPPKEQTVTIMEMGSDLHVKVSGTAADGSKIAVEYTVPAAGGAGKVIEGGSYDGITSKRLGPNEREVSYMKGGKAVYTTHSKLGADGKSLAVSAKGVNPMGMTVDAEVAYDKQK